MTSGVTARVRGGDDSVFAAGAVERFHALYPGVEIDFADGEPHENLARLKARELDLAIVFEFDSWPIGMDYDGRILCADDGFDYVDLFYLVLRRDDPLAGRKRIGLERIAAKRILGGPPWGPDLRLLCNRCGFEPRFDSKYRRTDFSAFQSLVAAGLGVTLVPRLAFGSIREDVVLRRLDPAPVRHVKRAVRAEGYRSSATEAMLRGLVAAVRDLPAE